MRDAVSAIEADPTAFVTVGDIAKPVGVSVRALEAGFAFARCHADVAASGEMPAASRRTWRVRGRPVRDERHGGRPRLRLLPLRAVLGQLPPSVRSDARRGPPQLTDPATLRRPTGHSGSVRRREKRRFDRDRVDRSAQTERGLT